MPDPEATKKARQVKQQYEKNWLSIEGVTAVGIGLIDNEHVGIIISVRDDVAAARQTIPEEVEGIRVKIQKTGEFRAQ